MCAKVKFLLALLLKLTLVQSTVDESALSYPECEDQRVTFTAEPSDGEVTCGDAFFPCRYTGTLSQPHWIINSTPYNSINSNLPPDHSYGSQVLRVTNLSGKDGIMYRCYILSLQRGTTCAYRSAVGQLNLSSCKGFSMESSPLYYYENKTLKEIVTRTQKTDGVYIITYVDSSNNSIVCGSTTINASSCTSGICNDHFGIESSSLCPDGTDITVIATASSSVDPLKNTKIDAVNKFLDISFPTLKWVLSVNCTFINQPMEGEKICNITVWPDCKNVSGFHSAARFSNASFVEVVIDGVTLEKIEKFCFLLNGSNGTKIVHVGGEHRISGTTFYSQTHSLTRTTLFSVILCIIILNV